MPGVAPFRVPAARLLPDRHRARRAAGRAATTGSCASTAWSTTRSTLDFGELLALPLVERDDHPDVRLERGRRRPDRQRARGSAYPIRDLLRAGRVRRRRRHGAVDRRRRLHGGHPARGAHRRPRRDPRRRHERRAAAARARLPGADGRARPLRLRVGDEVGGRPRGDPVRPMPTPTGRTRGWSERGPIKLESRIDVPRDGAAVQAGTRRGRRRRLAAARAVSSGSRCRSTTAPWQKAELGTEASIDTWVQWGYAVDAGIRLAHPAVRATDRTGEQQTSTQAPPAPDGASGWHTVDGGRRVSAEGN